MNLKSEQIYNSWNKSITFEITLELSKDAKNKLNYWVNKKKQINLNIYHPTMYYTICTDATETGWRRIGEDKNLRSSFSRIEKQNHINALEIIANNTRVLCKNTAYILGSRKNGRYSFFLLLFPTLQCYWDTDIQNATRKSNWNFNHLQVANKNMVSSSIKDNSSTTSRDTSKEK